MRSRWALVLCCAVAACGGRPGTKALLADLPADASSLGDAGAADAPDAAASHDAAPVPPCIYVPGAEVAITEPPSDKSLHAAVTAGDSVWIAWQVSNPDPPHDNTRRLQRLSYAATPLGDPAALFPPPGQWNGYGGASLAAGPEHYGAAVWDEGGGCQFRGLSATGEPGAGPQRVGDVLCRTLRSRPDGFSLFEIDDAAQEIRLLTLSPTGALVTRGPSIAALAGDVFYWSSVVLGDGSYHVLASRDGFSPTHLLHQQIDATGEPLTEPMKVAEVAPSASHVRLAAVTGGFLAGWLTAVDEAVDDQRRRIVIQPLAPDGRVTGAREVLDERIAYRDAGWSWTEVEDGFLAAFAEPLEPDTYGNLTSLVVQQLSAAGAPKGAAIEVLRSHFIRSPQIRATPEGAVVVYEAQPTGVPTQLYGVPLRCERREGLPR